MWLECVGVKRYLIAPNFRSAQFSRIGVFKNCRRDNGSFSINAELNFRGSVPIREKRENYAPRKFGAIRYIDFHIITYPYST